MKKNIIAMSSIAFLSFTSCGEKMDTAVVMEETIKEQVEVDSINQTIQGIDEAELELDEALLELDLEEETSQEDKV